MKEFEALLTTIQRLLSPEGCPWDREQTLHSMRTSLLEETSEVIEAIDSGDSNHIEEELGDLFFNVLFLCLLAHKEGKGSLERVLEHITHKLVRRHPHVFGTACVETTEGVVRQWEAIKREERGLKGEEKGPCIPKHLPVLLQAQKLWKWMQKRGYREEQLFASSFENKEQEWGAAFFRLVINAAINGVEAEQAVRAFLGFQEAHLYKEKTKEERG